MQIVNLVNLKKSQSDGRQKEWCQHFSFQETRKFTFSQNPTTQMFKNHNLKYGIQMCRYWMLSPNPRSQMLKIDFLEKEDNVDN